jgi:Tfp pilus assembly protein PilF
MRLRCFILAGLVACFTALAAPSVHADARSDAKAKVDFGIKVSLRGLWREAIYWWEQAVQIDPSYAHAYNNLGVGYEQEGDLEKARVAYEKALTLAPKDQQIRQNYELFKEINERSSAQPKSDP